nr:translation initiation factor IF-2-like [Gorilla gorilla gorilla]
MGPPRRPLEAEPAPARGAKMEAGSAAARARARHRPRRPPDAAVAPDAAARAAAPPPALPSPRPEREASPRGGRGLAGAAYLGPRRACLGARRGRRRRELRRRRAAAAAAGFAPCWGFGGGGGAGARFLVTQAAGPRTHGAGRAGHLFGARGGGRRGREIRPDGPRGACADRHCQFLTSQVPPGPEAPGRALPAPRGRPGRGTMVSGRTAPGSSAHARQGGTFRPPEAGAGSVGLCAGFLPLHRRTGSPDLSRCHRTPLRLLSPAACLQDPGFRIRGPKLVGK